MNCLDDLLQMRLLKWLMDCFGKSWKHHLQ